MGLISLSEGINDVSIEIGFLYALIASISYGIAVNMVEPLIKKYDSLIIIKVEGVEFFSPVADDEFT